MMKITGAPRGFGDLVRRAIYFQGTGEALLIIFWGAWEQANTFGDLGSTAIK